jgi:hypothetical protein
VVSVTKPGTPESVDHRRRRQAVQGGRPKRAFGGSIPTGVAWEALRIQLVWDEFGCPPQNSRSVGSKTLTFR